jgi:hypothetical protein
MERIESRVCMTITSLEFLLLEKKELKLRVKSEAPAGVSTSPMVRLSCPGHNGFDTRRAFPEQSHRLALRKPTNSQVNLAISC